MNSAQQTTNETNKRLTDELSNMRALLLNRKAARIIESLSMREMEELDTTQKQLNLIQLIIKYAAQFRKDDKKKDLKQLPSQPQQQSTIKRSSTQTILEENLQIENELKTLFHELYLLTINSSSFHKISTFNSLFESIYGLVINNLSDSNSCSKYLQESLIDMLINVAVFHANTVKVN